MENIKLVLCADPTAPFDQVQCALDFRRVRDLKLKDVEVLWGWPTLDSWKSALNFEEVKGLEMSGVVCQAAPRARQRARHEFRPGCRRPGAWLPGVGQHAGVPPRHRGCQQRHSARRQRPCPGTDPVRGGQERGRRYGLWGGGQNRDAVNPRKSRISHPAPLVAESGKI
jgi:hypothetical protein